MLSTEDIIRTLERHPWLPRPKYIYILNAPVIFPELRAIVNGLNPGWERETVILASTATPETLIHECIHVAHLGEIAAHLLSPVIYRFRRVIPPIISRPVKYRVRKISSRELMRYGLESYARANHIYLPKELEAIQMEREE